jgi:sporulation protein YlmC with PRC-barrel domain
MIDTKRYWAALQLLDRQIVDRVGRMAGNVDDVELEVDDDGRLYVSAVLAGPGVLAPRLGLRRFGNWLRRAHAVVEDDGGDPARVPLARIADIGNHVTVSLQHEEMGTFHGERWMRDHVIGRIPGSRHAAE